MRAHIVDLIGFLILLGLLVGASGGIGWVVGMEDVVKPSLTAGFLMTLGAVGYHHWLGKLQTFRKRRQARAAKTRQLRAEKKPRSNIIT